jgi:hypothetical protein
MVYPHDAHAICQILYSSQSSTLWLDLIGRIHGDESIPHSHYRKRTGVDTGNMRDCDKSVKVRSSGLDLS